jgi:L-alanine-DL-glutamate epimerase-like enolase superfamily enzyme
MIHQTPERAAPMSRSDTTIASAKVTLLSLPFDEQPLLALNFTRDREILVLEIETVGGHVGLGYQLFLRNGFKTVKTALEEQYLPPIIGRDATEVEGLWNEAFRGSIADGRMGANMYAISAIDVALWDIVGQAANLPLHRLWGNVRTEVPVYGSGCWRAMGGEGMAEKAARFVEQGFKAIKMQVGHIWTDAQDVANVALVRDTVGSEIDVMVDVNMAWTADKAIIMGHKLEEHGIYWLEEPVISPDFAGYRRIAKALTRTRVVGGESHFTRFDMQPFFEDPCCPILQPDVVRGGLTELRKIAIIADTWGIKIAPHLYPELMIHLCASIPNSEILEDMGLMSGIFVNAPQAANGMITAPETPGHGLKILPEVMIDAAVK